MAGDRGNRGPSLEERVEGVERDMGRLETILIDIRDNRLNSIARDIAWIKPLLLLILAAIVAGAVAVILTN